jgi:hypothetical protein
MPLTLFRSNLKRQRLLLDSISPKFSTQFSAHLPGAMAIAALPLPGKSQINRDRHAPAISLIRNLTTPLARSEPATYPT